ncbi:MAG: phosphoribosylformylglycinamidine synthase [Deltaproteobacteria bacterium]|nr:phosphoribosylformylglycinamidine synthase [Candidatus Anaeroferrophillus wilburensis]MBN2889154.1 phosphoribosylformylglycinamidine synthase [Deltaproteobacteria bacterium]
MAHHIEVYYQQSELDARAVRLMERLQGLGLAGRLFSVSISDVYTLEGDFSAAELEQAAQLLSNPVIHQVLVNRSRDLAELSHVLEVGFLPGVTDNVAATTRETLQDSWQRRLPAAAGVYSSQIFYLAGEGLGDDDLAIIAASLANPLIQRVQIKDRVRYLADGGMDSVIPRVSLTAGMEVSTVDLQLSEEQLVALGKEGIIDHLDAQGQPVRRGPLALDLPYLAAIKAYFQNREHRAPTDVELESLAQTWSEHCKHTIFAASIDELVDGLYRTYIKGATAAIRARRGADDPCVSVFVDNSGAIIFDDRYLVTDKVETHNSPSALDPFGGSITGIVGVNRDTIGFGMGAKPVLNRYGFCFADPADRQPLYRSPGRLNQALLPRQIMDGVIEGVRVGGNCSGIPTTQGFMTFDPRYKGKPLVFVGTVGLIPRQLNGKPSHLKQARAGDYIVMVGGRVGLDGIHGATFSSEAMTSGSPATAVQIGDPITQKKFSDCLVKEVRDRELYHSITDNGAGGLSCSVAEMARECGGCYVELDKVPTKYPGMAPWQIWISESQERMTMSVPPENWAALAELLQRRGVEATVIGRFTDSGRCQVVFAGQMVVDMELDFLHNGLPPKVLQTAACRVADKPVSLPESIPVEDLFLQMFSRLNICSRAFVSTQYDFEVQGGSVLKPLVGKNLVDNVATVIRPVLDSPRGVAVSQSLYPAFAELDPYAMAAVAIDTAVRNLIAVGSPLAQIALLDNFCWCSSHDSQRLWQLKEAARACYDIAVAYGTPFISGKDSMFNDFSGFDADDRPLTISVPPTLLISSLGVVPHVAQVRTFAFCEPGDVIYLLGETGSELGGSEFAGLLQDQGLLSAAAAEGMVPQVQPDKFLPAYGKVAQLVEQGFFRTLYPLAQGGLAVALGKSSMANGLGCTITLPAGQPPEPFLFVETPGRFLVTVAADRRSLLEQEFGGSPHLCLGVVSDRGRLIITQGEEACVDVAVDELLAAYRRPFADF